MTSVRSPAVKFDIQPRPSAHRANAASNVPRPSVFRKESYLEDRKAKSGFNKIVKLFSKLQPTPRSKHAEASLEAPMYGVPLTRDTGAERYTGRATVAEYHSDMTSATRHVHTNRNGHVTRSTVHGKLPKNSSAGDTLSITTTASAWSTIADDGVFDGAAGMSRASSQQTAVSYPSTGATTPPSEFGSSMLCRDQVMLSQRCELPSSSASSARSLAGSRLYTPATSTASLLSTSMATSMSSMPMSSHKSMPMAPLRQPPSVIITEDSSSTRSSVSSANQLDKLFREPTMSTSYSSISGMLLNPSSALTMSMPTSRPSMLLQRDFLAVPTMSRPRRAISRTMRPKRVNLNAYPYNLSTIYPAIYPHNLACLYPAILPSTHALSTPSASSSRIHASAVRVFEACSTPSSTRTGAGGAVHPWLADILIKLLCFALLIKDDLLDFAVRCVRFCAIVDRRLSSITSSSSTLCVCNCDQEGVCNCEKEKDEEVEQLVNEAVRAYLTSQSMLTWLLAVGWVVGMVAYMHVTLWQF